MADVQKENGFTSVAHEILDEICQYKFNGAQLRIIIKIWRLTYGYSRKDHDFSISFLSECTRLAERTVKKEIKTLLDLNVLIETKRATRSNSRRIAFNKDYDVWMIERSGGDDMPEQLDLFSVEVHDHAPNSQPNEVHDCSPHEVHDCSPNSVFEGNDCSPINRYKDLKISIKDKYALFDRFYEIYPRKVSRKKAQESWNRLCNHNDFNPIQALEQTQNFADTCKLLETETKFIAYPATFLNQKRYEDYTVVDPEGLAQSGNKGNRSTGSAIEQRLREELGIDEQGGRTVVDEVHFGGLLHLPD
ncbi:Bacteriophage replication protein O [compost metagenome]